jgi:transcription initiation factor TFIID TATA-box-binding protein
MSFRGQTKTKKTNKDDDKVVESGLDKNPSRPPKPTPLPPPLPSPSTRIDTNDEENGRGKRKRPDDDASGNTHTPIPNPAYTPETPVASTTTTATAVPYGKPADAPPDWIPEYVIQNIVATFNFGQKDIDLKHIGLKYGLICYNPKRFPAAKMYISNPKATVLVFKNGSAVCAGAKSSNEAMLAARLCVRAYNRLDIDFFLVQFKLQNIVATTFCDFRMNLDLLKKTYECRVGIRVSFEENHFPALTLRMEQPKVAFLLYRSRRIVCTGAKNKKDILDAWKLLYKILQYFRIPDDVPDDIPVKRRRRGDERVQGETIEKVRRKAKIASETGSTSTDPSEPVIPEPLINEFIKHVTSIEPSKRTGKLTGPTLGIIGGIEDASAGIDADIDLFEGFRSESEEDGDDSSDDDDDDDDDDSQESGDRRREKKNKNGKKKQPTTTHIKRKTQKRQ